MFLPRLAGGVTALDGMSVHLHCTDTEGEWLIVRDGDDLVVTREHAKGDVAARGTASDVLRFLWGRGGADQLEVFGDARRVGALPRTDHGLSPAPEHPSVHPPLRHSTDGCSAEVDVKRAQRARSASRTRSPVARMAGAVVVTPLAA